MSTDRTNNRTKWSKRKYAEFIRIHAKWESEVSARQESWLLSLRCSCTFQSYQVHSLAFFRKRLVEVILGPFTILSIQQQGNASTRTVFYIKRIYYIERVCISLSKSVGVLCLIFTWSWIVCKLFIGRFHAKTPGVDRKLMFESNLSFDSLAYITVVQLWNECNGLGASAFSPIEPVLIYICCSKFSSCSGIQAPNQIRILECIQKSHISP